jgi:hypothetical protein
MNSAFRRRCISQADDRPYLLDLKDLTQGAWHALSTRPCSFCGSNQLPEERSLTNVAVLKWKEPIVDSNVLPSCPLCWSVRSGKTPEELRTKARKITDFVENRRAAVFDTVSKQWSSSERAPAVVYRSGRREKQKCQRELAHDAQRQINVLMAFPCYYCGDESSGIDRVQSSTCPTYSTGNMVPCCSDCNSMKHVLPKNTFLGHMKRLTNEVSGGNEDETDPVLLKETNHQNKRRTIALK